MNKGKILTTEPLKSLEDVERVRRTIESDLRAVALFRVGTNTALRASDILKLKRKDLKGDELFIREKKTGKLRRMPLNPPTVEAVNRYLSSRTDDWEWMFVGQRGKMTHGYLGKMVKTWFIEAGIPPGQYASHSMRKTFVRIQHEIFGVSMGTLMTALNHSTEAQTLAYCGLTAEDVAEAYANEI
jgi:integrase